MLKVIRRLRGRSRRELSLVRERMRTQYAVSVELAGATDLGEVAGAVLRIIAETSGWDLGVFWRAGGTSDGLVPLEFWSRAPLSTTRFEKITRDLHPDQSVVLPFRAAISAEPQWVNDIRRASADPRAAAAAELGLHGAAAFPIVLQEQVLGVLEFHGRSPVAPDAELLEMLELLTRQLALFMQRIQAESALRASEHSSRAIVESVPGIVWEAWGEPDSANQRIDFVSDHVETMLGYTVEEWVSTPNFWLSIVHPEDRERAAREAVAIFERGSGSSEFRWITRDGNALWVEAQSVAIWDEAGRSVGMRGVTMDITARKKIEERQSFMAEAGALLTSSLDYRRTLANVARLAVPRLADWCAVDIVDEEDGSIQRIAVEHQDPGMVELAREMKRRYPPPAGSGEGVAEVIRSGEPILLREIPETLIDRAEIPDEQRRVLRELGLRSAMIVPLIARERTFGAITFVMAETEDLYDGDDLVLAQDLARRAAMAIDNSRLYQEAKIATRARDEFLATLSHELRTPMTAILGWARMLSLGELEPGEADDAIQTILRSAEAQARLIDDVLDVSRIITGKMKISMKKVDLASVAEDALRTIEPAAEVKSIRLEREIQPVPETRGDPARIGQILWNLLSNAVKFTPKGGRVTLRLRQVESMVKIQVEDSGEGIDPEFMAHAFDRFRQAEGSTVRSHGGLGLGLAIVRHLTEMHGGEVHAVSKGRGEGSIFTVDLPIAAVEPLDRETAEVGEDTATRRRRLGQLPDLDGVRVLIVDDEADARDLVRSVLESCHAEVETSSSAGEALALVEREHPDLIISDIGMPEMDGFELARRLREGNGHQPNPVPLVALTAYGREEDRERILCSGFQAYVRKPADPIDLAGTVRRVLDETPTV